MPLSDNVSFIDNIIEDTPDRYENTIQSRIISKQLKLTLQQYDNLQNQYNMLLKNSLQTKNKNKWVELNDQNYMYGMVDADGNSNDNFKFLGKANSLNECKLKAIEDENTEYSSIVYNTSTINGNYSKSCYGNIKDRNHNKHTENGFITALAPNGSSRIGGSEGDVLLKKMTQLQEEIKTYVSRLENIKLGLKNTGDIINHNKTNINNDMNTIIDRLKQDKIELDKLLTKPDESGVEENSRIQQISNYTRYLIWVILVILSLILVSRMYLFESTDISIFTYIFIIVWLIIFGIYYYKQIISFVGKLKQYILYISNSIRNSIPII